MKYKRNERLVDMTTILLAHPNRKFSLQDFQDRYQTAKSSMSEDFSILDEIFRSQGIGLVETFAGVSGGVVFRPQLNPEIKEEYLQDLLQGIQKGQRILPGGYIYLTDILGNTELLRKIGKLIANDLVEKSVDYVMTVATKGIPVAQALAYELGVPFIIAHKDSKVTEGTTISVKYTSESSPNRVQRMEVVRDVIEAGANVVLVDDFHRGGGTMEGLSALVESFRAQVLGKYVLCENHSDSEISPKDVKSLVAIKNMNPESGHFTVVAGSLFN